MGTQLAKGHSKPDAVHFGLEQYTGLIDQLIRVSEPPAQVISCYLRLHPEDRRNQAYLRWLKDQIAHCRAGLPASLTHDQRECLERDMVRIIARVEDPEALPSTRGLALFACEKAGLFAEAPLPDVVRPGFMVGDSPRVAELVEQRERFLPIVVLALDRRHARIFEVTPWTVAETGDVPAIATPAGKFHEDHADAPGWGERSYHSRIHAEQHRFHLTVLQALEVRCQPPIRGFVLGGPPRQTLAFRRVLTATLRPLLLGTVRLNPARLTVASIERMAQTVAGQHVQYTRQRMDAELSELVGAGWASTDTSEVLRALNHNQVRRLLVAVPVPDRLDEVIQLGLRQRVEVVCLPESMRTEVTSPLAAIFRHR